MIKTTLAIAAIFYGLFFASFAIARYVGMNEWQTCTANHSAEVCFHSLYR